MKGISILKYLFVYGLVIIVSNGYSQKSGLSLGIEGAFLNYQQNNTQFIDFKGGNFSLYGFEIAKGLGSSFSLKLQTSIGSILVNDYDLNTHRTNLSLAWNLKRIGRRSNIIHLSPFILAGAGFESYAVKKNGTKNFSSIYFPLEAGVNYNLSSHWSIGIFYRHSISKLKDMNEYIGMNNTQTGWMNVGGLRLNYYFYRMANSPKPPVFYPLANYFPDQGSSMDTVQSLVLPMPEKDDSLKQAENKLKDTSNIISPAGKAATNNSINKEIKKPGIPSLAIDTVRIPVKFDISVTGQNKFNSPETPPSVTQDTLATHYQISDSTNLLLNLMLSEIRNLKSQMDSLNIEPDSAIISSIPVSISPPSLFLDSLFLQDSTSAFNGDSTSETPLRIQIALLENRMIEMQNQSAYQYNELAIELANSRETNRQILEQLLLTQKEDSIQRAKFQQFASIIKEDQQRLPIVDTLIVKSVTELQNPLNMKEPLVVDSTEVEAENLTDSLVEPADEIITVNPDTIDVEPDTLIEYDDEILFDELDSLPSQDTVGLMKPADTLVESIRDTLATDSLKKPSSELKQEEVEIPDSIELFITEKELVAEPDSLKNSSPRNIMNDSTETLEIIEKDVKRDLVFPPIQQVYFKSNSSEIEERFKPLLDSTAYYLLDHPETFLHLSGFADTLGNPAYNLNLSRKRVEAVKTYFMQKAVQDQRITTVFFGSSTIMTEGNKFESERRVQIEILINKD